MRRSPVSPFEFIALFALLTALTPLSLDAVLPALAAMGERLSVERARDLQLVVTMFIFGMVFGELLFGPIADAYGRKFAVLAGLAIYAAGTLVALTAGSLDQLIVGRIVQGIGVSGPKIGARAFVRDRFEGDAMGRAMSLIFTVLIFVPLLAPAFGQLLQAVAGWRSIFVFYLTAALVAGGWLLARQPESLEREARIPIRLGALLRNTGAILRRPWVTGHIAATGLIFGAQLLYLSTAQSLFSDIYGRAAGFPVYFAILAAGIGLASFVNSRLVMRHGMSRMVGAALTGLAAASAALLALGMFHDGVPPFWSFMLLFFGMFFCIGILFGNLNALTMQPLGQVAGLGASLNASLSSLVAVAFAMGFGWFHGDTIIPVTLGFLTAALASMALVGRVKGGSGNPVQAVTATAPYEAKSNAAHL